jgi:hypothetical protein
MAVMAPDDENRTTRTNPNNGGEFFIGYKPTPPGLVRMLRMLVPPLLVVVAVVGVAVSALQKSPGTGVWETGTPRSFEGIVTAEPYAMIDIADPSSNSAVRTVLLVSEGKFGAVQRIRPFDGQAVRVTGTLLHRDERWMLELAGDAGAVQPASLPTDAERRLHKMAAVHLGPITLRGEIIDPKCYSGAMKPGSGKTHKACGQLCVGGGIPPMFVTIDGQGHETLYLLTSEDGRAVNERVLPYLGDPVELTGQLWQRGTLLVVRIGPAAIRRL